MDIHPYKVKPVKQFINEKHKRIEFISFHHEIRSRSLYASIAKATGYRHRVFVCLYVLT